MLPLGRLPAGGLDDPPSDLDYQSCFFCNLNESLRDDQAMCRVSPSNKRFEFFYSAGSEFNYGLVISVKLAAIYRMSQICFQLQDIQIMGVHLTVKDLVARLTGLLSSIHRRISVAKEIICFSRQIIGDDNADACRREYFIVVDLEGLRDLRL